MKGFVAGSIVTSLLFISVVFARSKVVGPPYGGIPAEDMMQIAAYLRDDLASCRDTIIHLKTNLSSWRIEIHPTDPRPRHRMQMKVDSTKIGH